MWILESSGGALKGKKLWLPPGKKFLFGRTKPDTGEDNFVVLDKTISRRHLTVEIEATGPSDCANARSRSRITLTDLETKIGTIVNGRQIRGESYVLESEESRIQLGRCKEEFTIKWVPVVLTFSFTSKEHKSDPYTSLYKQLGPLDVKVLIEYQNGNTSHVVAKKRNTSKGLQALIDGKYIVHNDSWVKELIAAATPGTAESSLLERDFEAHFPDPLRFLPPKGDEPTQRDEVAYAPDARRKAMFDGYTFVFYSRPQYENLSAPITGGQGKTLLREIVPDQTTCEEFVQYVKNVAGEKGLGSFDDGSDGKGVVVVRFNPVKGAGSDWYKDFSTKVALHLDHRLIEQNEFLDAILGNDASVLRRPLQVEQSGVFEPPATAASNVPQNPQNSQVGAPTSSTIEEPTSTQTQFQEMGPPDLPRRGRARRTARPQFKGFDDDFSNLTTTEPAAESMEIEPILDPIPESQPSQGLFVSQDPDMMAEVNAPQVISTQSRNSRKRKPSPIFDIDEVDEEDVLEQIAPATAAVKRRKVAEEAERRRRGESTPPPPLKPVPKAKPDAPKIELEVQAKGKKKKEPDIDVLEVARLQREAEAAKAKAEREQLESQLEDMTIEEIRKRIAIVDVPIRRSERRQRAAQADESDRWDDRWNGRKNFKKFRRQGVHASGNRQHQKVIVQLEEVKKKDYGIGDEYWDHGDIQRRKKGKARESQMDVRSQTQSTPSSLPQPHNSAVERAARLLKSGIPHKEADDADAFGAGDLSPERDPPDSSIPTLVDKSTASTQHSQTSRKRVAQATLVHPTAGKKQRQLGLERSAARRGGESDSDSDDMKFRFRKRK